jgi:protease I
MRAGVRLPGKNILMVIAPQDYCERQLHVSRYLFELHGASVTVASVRTGRVHSLQGGSSTVRQSLPSINAGDYDALLVVGGPGAEVHLWPDRCLQALLDGANAAKKVVGAICLAPVVLARAGILAGRKATVSMRAEARAEMRAANVTIDPRRVVRAEHVVTATDEAATLDWAYEVMRALA